MRQMGAKEVRKLLGVAAVCMAALIPAVPLAAAPTITATKYHNGPVHLTAALVPEITSGTFDIEQFIGPDNAYEDVTDNGHNNIYSLYVAGVGESDFHETNCVTAGGLVWCLLKDDSGLCADAGSDKNVYAESCPTNPPITPEQWYDNGTVFENRHFGLELSTYQNPNSGVRFIDVAQPGLPWDRPAS